MKFIYFANLDSIAASNKRIIMRWTWSIEKPHFFHLTYVNFGESSCSFVRWAQSIRAQLKAYSSAYFVKNISTLLFLRHLSTLDNYSWFFTLDSRLFTLNSRHLFSTLDIYSRLSTFYSRLSTFTLDSRPSTFRYTLAIIIQWEHVVFVQVVRYCNGAFSSVKSGKNWCDVDW